MPFSANVHFCFCGNFKKFSVWKCLDTIVCNIAYKGRIDRKFWAELLAEPWDSDYMYMCAVKELGAADWIKGSNLFLLQEARIEIFFTSESYLLHGHI